MQHYGAAGAISTDSACSNLCTVAPSVVTYVTLSLPMPSVMELIAQRFCMEYRGWDRVCMEYRDRDVILV